MAIKYERAFDIELLMRKIVNSLEMKHIKTQNVVCFRSKGSKAKYTIARCWALPRIFQKALNVDAHYCLEVISERFDRLSNEEKERVMIHELLHIPKAFGGGVKKHGYVTEKRVNDLHRQYLKASRKCSKHANI